MKRKSRLWALGGKSSRVQSTGNSTQRRTTEAKLRAGSLDCVVATNALELGVDIGALAELAPLHDMTSFSSMKNHAGILLLNATFFGTGASLITFGAVDHISHRFACLESSNVFEKNQSGGLRLGHAGDVRRNQDLRMLPKSMIHR
jgi:hypothetical protein